MKIDIRGAIIPDAHQWIYDMFEVPAVSPNKVFNAIKDANGEELEVTIASGGGSVFAGSEIYTALKSYTGKVTGTITSIAGSAASVIAMGIDNLLISPTAQIMIHKASNGAEGNADDMIKNAEILNGIDKSIANAYMLKTGLSQSDLLQMMGKETWLTAQEAKEKGFVNGVLFEADTVQPNNILNAVNGAGLLPDQVINKMMADKFSNVQKQSDLELAKARLRLLNL